MRRPSRAVELDDMISSRIIGDDPKVISIAVNTHLALEAILIEVLELFQLSEKEMPKSFPGKTEWLADHNVIGADDKKAFDLFNDFRNDLAHIFAHKISLADALALARDLEARGVDFSDSVGHYSEDEASEHYDGIIGVLAEIGWNILFHAGWLLQQAGGRDIFSELNEDTN